MVTSNGVVQCVLAVWDVVTVSRLTKSARFASSFSAVTFDSNPVYGFSVKDVPECLEFAVGSDR